MRFLFVLGLVLSAVNAGAAYFLARSTVETATLDQLRDISIEKQAAVESWLSQKVLIVEAVAELIASAGVTGDMPYGAEDADSRTGDMGSIRKWLKIHRAPFADQIESLLLLHPESGEVLVATREEDEGKFLNRRPYFQQGRQKVTVYGPYFSLPRQRAILTIAVPIRDARGLRRVLVGYINLQGLSEITDRKEGEAATLHSYLVNQANLFISQPALSESGAILRKANFTAPVRACLEGRSATTMAQDYRAVSALFAYRWVPEYNLCLITQIDETEALERLQFVALQFFVSGAAAILLMVILVLAYVPGTIRQISELVLATRRVRQNDFGVEVPESAGDELGELATNFNDMVRQLKERDHILRWERERLEETQQQAVEASKAKSTFLSNMSHELRTPLNAVIGLTNLTLDTELNKDQRNYLTRVSTAGRNLLGIINDILDFSKIEAGKLTMEEIDFPLRDVLANMETVISPTAKENNVSIRIAISEGLPQRFTGDPLRVGQILINIAGNAVKFTHDGEVHITVEPAADDAQGMVISIRDTGIGMSEEQVAKLFRPFSQADQSITRTFGGTGLGLTISRQLAEAMGGAIQVESSPDQGSLFRVSLPLPAAADSATGGVESVKPLSGGGYLRALGEGNRVLMAEDNELNRTLNIAILERADYLVDVVENGRQAVERISAAGPGHYLAVLMDIQMPVLDGLSATREIRALSGFEELPIIALTAHAIVEERQKCFEAGMNAHMTKPFDADELISRLRRFEQGEEVTHGSGLDAPVEEVVGTDMESESWTPARIDLPDDIRHVIVGDFLDKYGEADLRLRRMVEAGELEQARDFAHEFKGVAGSIGVVELHKGLIEVESCLRNNKPEDAGLQLSALRKVMGRTADLMREYLARDGAGQG